MLSHQVVHPCSTASCSTILTDRWIPQDLGRIPHEQAIACHLDSRGALPDPESCVGRRKEDGGLPHIPRLSEECGWEAFKSSRIVLCSNSGANDRLIDSCTHQHKSRQPIKEYHKNESIPTSINDNSSCQKKQLQQSRVTILASYQQSDKMYLDQTVPRPSASNNNPRETHHFHVSSSSSWNQPSLQASPSHDLWELPSVQSPSMVGSNDEQDFSSPSMMDDEQESHYFYYGNARSPSTDGGDSLPHRQSPLRNHAAATTTGNELSTSRRLVLGDATNTVPRHSHNVAASPETTNRSSFRGSIFH